MLKKLIINFVIFFTLITGSILFEFLVLGWGASANAPDFNADFALIVQISTLFIVGIYQLTNQRKYDWLIVGFVIALLYLTLKYGIHWI